MTYLTKQQWKFWRKTN